jgi:lipopolysaccharide biosynthesis glycosyltransferase
MPDCCIVYNPDSNYMFPTLVSAMQARRHSSPSDADVIIFCVGLDARAEKLFAPICAKENIGLIPVQSDDIEGQTAMLARLFLNRYVPAQYSQFLYLDSDIHILDSLDPLIDAEVPPGHFLAANDPMTFLLADDTPQSRDLSSHLQSVGLSAEQASKYFNSGVLRINRKGWDSIGSQAWEAFQRNNGDPRFPDQDVLNLVAADKRLQMSLAWNFPIFMRNSFVEYNIKPKIVHFMSSPKPWDGVFPPWTEDSCRPYSDAVRKYPQLAHLHKGMVLRKRARYHLQQRGKKLSETFTWGLSQRRGRILNYEASCPL